MLTNNVYKRYYTYSTEIHYGHIGVHIRIISTERKAINIPNIGDKVYLIYIGYVTVKDVHKNGDITINIHGKESRVPTSHYRTMDRMQPYFDRGYIIEDYTE